MRDAHADRRPKQADARHSASGETLGARMLRTRLEFRARQLAALVELLGRRAPTADPAERPGLHRALGEYRQELSRIHGLLSSPSESWSHVPRTPPGVLRR